MDYKKLADLLFPEIKLTPEEVLAKYPKRNLNQGAKVTRLGPSPTGFMHLGNLFGAFADERLAHQSDGVFYLRIEDTDDKRYVEGAVETIVNSLKFFGINFDEGASLEGDKGEYGPYTQSLRGEIYQTFAKSLVAQGKAYPCFLTSDEITKIRKEQESQKLLPGIYGKYATNRDLSIEEIEQNIAQGKEYVIRLKSDGNLDLPQEQIRKIQVEDAIRGTLEMPENNIDVVILKATGIPTYHFAHVVDDYLMRTTHVVRGAEWLSSLPIHVELFEKLGWEIPIYCHTAQLMKKDENGNKRKLSKREDPELSLTYYKSKGYHPKAVREYLLTLLNSNFEEWRIANPDADIDEFEFTTEKMSNSGALFDLQKLNDVSKDVLLKVSAKDLAEFLSDWISEYKPDYGFMSKDQAYLERVLDIDRNGNKPRKDHTYAEQMVKTISYFFDESFEIEDDFPEEAKDDVKTILTKYLETYDHSDDQEQWFNKIRDITEELGYAVRPKDYKKNPEDYKGHVGHVSTVIRIAIMGRTQSPDVWEIQQILGEERVKARIEEVSCARS